MYTKIGRIVNDIEVKEAGSAKVVDFRIAVRRKYKRDGEAITDFIPCVAFNKLAEVIGAHFVKGQQIYVEGEWENDPYTDKEGKKRDSWKVKLSGFDFAGPKPDGANAGGAVVDDEEIPFA